ncbi:hypothetical protein [Streptomyces sp. NPDC091217]|uniref:hypothetical protein n=1 Tax=Streptomyces sp. NPDC091217 TaxID=3365975 RepID=UPI0037F7140D
MSKAWADTGHRTNATPAPKGSRRSPDAGWSSGLRPAHCGRLARDYELHAHHPEAMIHVAMIDLMSRGLTRESTPNRRDT